MQLQPIKRPGTLLIVNLHPAHVVGGCEHFLRRLCSFAHADLDVHWYGSSTEFYTFLENVYRLLGLRASPLRLIEDAQLNAAIDVFSFRDLVPFTSRWRQARALFRDAHAVYVKNEFLEVALTFYFGGYSALRRATIGMHTPLVVADKRSVWSMVHNMLYRNALYRLCILHSKMLHSPSSVVRGDINYLFRGTRNGQRRGDLVLKKVRVIANGIHIGEKPTVKTGKSLRALAVGRICYQKGFDRLDAVAGPDLHITVIGDGDEARDLRIKMGNRLALRGALPQKDVLEEMASHDILLMPSRWENQPFTLLEAMSCGLLPIVQSLPQLVEQLPVDYRWLAVDFDDRAATFECIEKIKQIKADPKRWLAAKLDMWRHAKAHFDERVLFGDLLKAITE